MSLDMMAMLLRLQQLSPYLVEFFLSNIKKKEKREEKVRKQQKAPHIN